MDVADVGIISGVFHWVIFWSFVAAVVLVPRYLKSRERGKLLDTLKAAYDKGQPVPPELIDALQRGDTSPDLRPNAVTMAERDLRRAVVLIAVGIGIALLGYGLYYGISYSSVAGSGAIPGLIGVAYLLLYLTRGRPSQN
jgi:hypothetical protein